MRARAINIEIGRTASKREQVEILGTIFNDDHYRHPPSKCACVYQLSSRWWRLFSWHSQVLLVVPALATYTYTASIFFGNKLMTLMLRSAPFCNRRSVKQSRSRFETTRFKCCVSNRMWPRHIIQIQISSRKFARRMLISSDQSRNPQVFPQHQKIGEKDIVIIFA